MINVIKITFGLAVLSYLILGIYFGSRKSKEIKEFLGWNYRLWN